MATQDDVDRRLADDYDGGGGQFYGPQSMLDLPTEIEHHEDCDGFRMDHQPNAEIVHTSTRRTLYRPTCRCGWKYFRVFATWDVAVLVAAIAGHAPSEEVDCSCECLIDGPQ